MRFIWVLLFLSASFLSAGQDVFRLPIPDGTLFELRENWVYQMGDHPGAEKANFNDANWRTIRPAADIHDSLPDEVKNGIGWMRLRFRASEESKRTLMALMIQQMVASEIYLNGELLRKFGEISANPDSVKAFESRWEPLPVQFTEDSIQVLAVRFAVQPGIRYSFNYGNANPFLSVGVLPYARAVRKYQEIYQRPWIDLFMQGILCMVFILHLCFYIFYPVQQANLYFSLAALVNLFGNIIHNYFYFGAVPEQKFPLAVLLSVLYGISQTLMILSLYRYFNLKPGRLLISFIVFLLFSIIAGAAWYRGGFVWFLGWVHPFCYLIGTVVSIHSWRRQVKESVIPMVGFGIGLVAFTLFLVVGMINPVDHRLKTIWDAGGWIFLFVVIGPTTAFSVLLALDFARTSRRLGLKLQEVEALSEKNLAMEREKQEILSAQNQELERNVSERTKELQRSLQDLKASQAQLIQSEKMASLGELTAGIAHEIQNPLNFVNNFSDLNREMLDELNGELKKGDLQQASQLAESIRENEEKINLHGRRADGIVKSMLQHSRSSGGEKEPTDVNKLMDEYVRLAYHGYRARQKDFNVKLESDLDPSVGKVNMVKQDIGRVILNLLNNAFYAVAEKARTEAGDYTPTVWVRTRVNNPGSVAIEVVDNGPGIPESMREKIFQPFFTTKPTGQGTGLGLSLSYDIVKGHGGSIVCLNDQEGGAKLVIALKK